MPFFKQIVDYNRYQAFAIHLAFSSLIFFILLLIITQYWYPGLLFEVGNGWKAIGIIISIDLVLGPLLTLIIFNPKKPSLKFDLTIIAIIQSSALTYGAWVIHQSHPIALTHIGSSFHIIPANAPFADEISTLAKNNNYQLYYLIDEEDLSAELKPKQFLPYSQHSLNVIQELTSKNIAPPYLIQLEKPGKPYALKLDPDSGKIIAIEATNVSN